MTQQFPLNILIADPDEDDAQILIEALKEVNNSARPVYFNDGAPLMNYLADPNNPFPELIFLDVNTPPPDGRQLLQTIRLQQQFDELPIIVLTGSESQLDRDESRLLGANLFVRKPAGYAAMVSLIKKIFTDNWKNRMLEGSFNDFEAES